MASTTPDEPSPDRPRAEGRASSRDARQDIERALARLTEAANEDARRGRLSPERIANAIREFRKRHPY
jgi:GTP cyclohydrolase I